MRGRSAFRQEVHQTGPPARAEAAPPVVLGSRWHRPGHRPGERSPTPRAPRARQAPLARCWAADVCAVAALGIFLFCFDFNFILFKSD